MESSTQSGLQPTIGTEPGTVPGAQGAEQVAYAFPLTFAQQRLWFLSQLENNAASYNVPWAIRIEGALNIPLLERTLSEIVARHETLRTTFTLSGNEPVQIVHPAAPLILPVFDVSGLPTAQRETEARRLTQEEAVRPMDLVSGPLLRTSLVKLGTQDHILLLTVHHIVFDAWSRRIFVRELGAIYEALSAGQSSPLPELQLQYADYAVWQRGQLSGSTLERHLDYWRKQLDAAPSHLELPTDRPRPATQSFAGAVCTWKAPAALVEQLTALSRTSGTTLFMTLLAAFNVLLAKYSGQEDVVVGTPIANRNRAEIEALIGFFTNTLVLRADVSGDPSFLELLPRVKETALGAYAHQDMPFEKLVEELKPERSLGYNPLFQVFFSLQNSGTQSMQLLGLQLTTLERTGTTSKFDLSLFLTETADGLRGGMEYSTDLFDAATIERMLQHYERLLWAVVKSPEKPLSQLALLTEAERRQLIVEYNQTAEDLPLDQTLPHLFAAQAARTPQAVAVQFEASHLTFAELDARSNQLARYLQQRSAGRETHVALCLNRSLDMVVALLAVLKAGAAYLPLDPAYPKDRIGFILEDAQAPLLLTQSSLLSSLPKSAAQTICLDADWSKVAQFSSEPLTFHPSPGDAAYLLYTSGSTGQPKGVEIEHRALTNFLLSMQREPGLDHRDTLVAVTTLSFDIAGLEIYLPLITGARLVLASREQATDAQQLSTLLERSSATVMQATPATWRMLVDYGWRGRPNFKILVGGEALPPDLANQLRTRCDTLWNMYGPTETTIWSSVYAVAGDLNEIAPIGRAIANTQFYVLDGHRQLTPPGVPGELYIGGTGLARGYFHRKELTEEKFVSDPFSASGRLYRTGDLVRWTVDAQMEYIGRIDNQVKLRGYRIELGEIETALQRLEDVRQCLVMAREDQPGQQRLVAYWTATHKRGSSTASTEVLRAHLRQSLPDFMVPSAFVLLDDFPLTPNGKINRKALPAPENSESGHGVRLDARDDFEYMVFRIWANVLGTEAIGIRDNFFDVGGHSLLAVRMMREIQKATGKELPLSLLFKGATIEKLARILQEGEQLPPCPTLLEIQRGSASKTPFFAVVTPGVNALGYVALARHLGKDQPFYKLQKYARARTTDPYSAEAFKELASEYLRAMREVQPRGPYYLGGMCEGARIAYDMARILEAQGEKVALLAVLDTWVVEHTQIRLLGNLHYYSQRWQRFRGKTWREQKQEFFRVMGKKLRRRIVDRAEAVPGSTPKHTWNEHYWPTNFVAPKYSGDILLFKRPRQPFYYVRDPLLGWGNRTSGAVETIEIHSPHFFVLREPHVTEVGKLLSQALAKLTDRTALPASDERLTDSPNAAAVVYSR